MCAQRDIALSPAPSFSLGSASGVRQKDCMKPTCQANSRLLATSLSLAACSSPYIFPIDRFEAMLDSHASATEALTRWCEMHDLAKDPVIRAVPVIEDGANAIPPDVRALLSVSKEEPLGYRHVRLVCGETVLSEAHNWFVPSRLSDEMNKTLSTTQTPFGKAVASLDFTRRKLAGTHGGEAGCPDGTILTRRALLTLPDGRPISLVMECYTSANLTPAW